MADSTLWWLLAGAAVAVELLTGTFYLLMFAIGLAAAAIAAHQVDELAQVQHRRVEVRAGGELLVVDRQDEGTGPALLLRELRQVAVAGHAQHLEALALDRLGERTDAEAGGVLRTVVLVDDDDGKAKLHGQLRAGPNWKGAKCTNNA